VSGKPTSDHSTRTPPARSRRSGSPHVREFAVLRHGSCSGVAQVRHQLFEGRLHRPGRLFPFGRILEAELTIVEAIVVALRCQPHQSEGREDRYEHSEDGCQTLGPHMPRVGARGTPPCGTMAARACPLQWAAGAKERVRAIIRGVRGVALSIVSLALVVTMGLAVSHASGAPARGTQYQPKRYIARHCGASRNICVGIFQAHGIVFQLLIRDRYFTHYRICVRPPRGEKICHVAPINRQGAIYGSHVRWPRRFGDHGSGEYHVSWSHRGRPLGISLPFTRR
jgi:hypothetical protein